MTVDTSKSREQRLFEAALHLEAGPERQAFLEAVCTNDPELRQSLEQLLSAASEADAFFQNDPLVQAGVIQKTSLPTAKATAVTQNPGQRIGRYKLLQQIGEGGLGVVYMAEQEEPVRRRVALKIIKPGMDTQSVIARFEAERQALALMDHPNIAKILDGGVTEDGRPYFVMDLVQGLPVTQFCDDAKLTTVQRLALFVEICGAVQHAHQKGIIHRDLKPSNILVTLHGDKHMPKIIDFGIAKATQQRLTDKTLFTQFQHFIGTPAYMSPEQASLSSLDIDTRSDIYSLGVLLYELLTGKTPFDAKELLQAGLDEMRRTIREKEPERPSTKVSTLGGDELTTTAKRRGLEPPKLVSTLRGDLDWIVMKCLEKDRGRRYETANGLARDIQCHLKSEPVVACPPGRLYLLKKLIRRNRFVFGAATAVMLAILVGLGLFAWEYHKARNALHRTIAAEQEEARLRHAAETEAAKSKRVAQFLEDMLKSVNPSVALGRDTKLLKEILDKTAASLDSGLTNEPEVELELRSVLAETYRDLGLFDQMEKVAHASLLVARSRIGEDSEPVAASLFWLSQAQGPLGKVKEAEANAREALARYRKLVGNDGDMVAQSASNLGLLVWQRGDLADAEALFNEAIAIQKKLNTDARAFLSEYLNNLALVLRDEGKLKESEQTFREALAIAKQAHGEESPTVMLDLCNLALAVGDQQRLAEAEVLHRQALAMARKLLGNEHPDVAWTAANLASNLRKQGKFAESESLHRECLALRRKLLGNDNPDVANSLNSLAVVLGDQGRFAEAIPLYRDALAIRQKVYGQEHPAVANSLINLAVVLERAGKPVEAEPFCRQGQAMARKLLRSDHQDVLNSLDELGKILLDQARPAEAEPYLRESLVIREKTAPDQLGTFLSRSLLGAALLGQKKYGEAEPLLLSGYNGLNERQERLFAAQKLRLREALQRVLLFYEQTSQPDRAAEWKQKLSEFDAAARPLN